MKIIINWSNMKTFNRILTIFYIILYTLEICAQPRVITDVNITNIEQDKDQIILDIYNASSDTIYLFDSYLHESLPISKYLHRYNYRYNEYKLSFLPLLPYLSVDLSDTYISTNNKILYKGQILYHFIPIYPFGSHKIKLPINALFVNEYVDDINPWQFTKFDKSIEFKNRFMQIPQIIILEFAIYLKLKWLTNQHAYYFNEVEFNNEALSYHILRIPINTN